MPRKRVVTRTINGMEVSVLGIDLTNETTDTRDFIIGEVVPDAKRLLKKIERINKDVSFKPIAIKQARPVKQIRAMPEYDFILASTLIKQSYKGE